MGCSNLENEGARGREGGGDTVEKKKEEKERC